MTRDPSNIQLLMDLIILEIGHIAQINSDLRVAIPEQLMNYSKEAFTNMIREIQTINEDKDAGSLMSEAERYLHEVRRDKWRELFDNIWAEIDNRGQEVKHRLINQVLRANPLISQN